MEAAKTAVQDGFRFVAWSILLFYLVHASLEKRKGPRLAWMDLRCARRLPRVREGLGRCALRVVRRWVGGVRQRGW